MTGNLFSTVYDFSKLYYADRRLNSGGVLTREAIPNDELELEKKNTINAGLDLSLFKQAVNLHADYFISNVNNLIMRQQLPSAYGYSEYYDNGGVLQNSGFEVGIDFRVQTGDFYWILGANVSQVVGEITSLEFINPATESIVTNFPGGQFLTSVGGPVNAYYGFETDGLVTAADAGMIGPRGLPMIEGDVKFVDQDGDNSITEADKVIIGDPNPSMFGSVFTSLGWRNLELYVRLDYRSGNDLYNHMRTHTESMKDYANQTTAVLDRWSSSNPGGTLPGISYGDPRGNSEFSDRWIEDGSYMKLGQVTLNYNIPQRQGLFNGLTVYVTATNLLTITDYSGYDPEFAYMNQLFISGVDYGLLPEARTFIVGLKLNL